MPRVIVTSRYLKRGASVKRGNLVKYIATRETVAAYSPKEKIKLATENQEQLIEQLLNAFPDGKETHEYDDYKINPTKENASELISELIERHSDQITDREIFVKYLAERPGVEKIGKHGLFSYDNEEIDLAQAMKNVAEHQGNVWTHVVSLNRKDAERLGYTSPDVWRSLIMKNIGVIAEAQRIDLDKLCWYAAFHNTSHHPHIHLIVYSSDPKQGYLTKSGIDKIRSTIANNIFRSELQNLYLQQTVVRDKLRSEAKNVMTDLLSELQNNSEFDPQLEQLILKLQSQLKNSKGKKVYGYLQPNVKKTVDQIVAELAQNSVLKKMYAEWCKLEQQKYETYTNAVQKFPLLEENKVFKPIKNAVIQAVLDMKIFIPKTESLYDEALRHEELEAEKAEKNTTKKSQNNWGKDCKKAFKHLADGYYTSAYKEFSKIANEKPNDKILFRLGIMTLKGQGCEADRNLGIEYIKQSAELGNEYAQSLLENMNKHYQTATRNAVMSMLFSFGRLISDDYKRSLRGHSMRTEHKLKSAIRRKKQTLGLKENSIEEQNQKGW